MAGSDGHRQRRRQNCGILCGLTTNPYLGAIKWLARPRRRDTGSMTSQAEQYYSAPGHFASPKQVSDSKQDRQSDLVSSNVGRVVVFGCFRSRPAGNF